METPLLDKTDAAIKKAEHLKDPQYAGAVEAIRALARKIDAWDTLVQWAMEDIEDVRGARPAVPQNDNVSLASYLKYSEALGLTPAAQNMIPRKADAPTAAKKRGGALASVSNIPRPSGS
jgi:hypothetical protein